MKEKKILSKGLPFGFLSICPTITICWLIPGVNFKLETFLIRDETVSFYMYEMRPQLHLTQNFRQDQDETESLGVFF